MHFPAAVEFICCLVVAQVTQRLLAAENQRLQVLSASSSSQAQVSELFGLRRSNQEFVN